jgi:hypothetical protein
LVIGTSTGVARIARTVSVGIDTDSDMATPAWNPGNIGKKHRKKSNHRRNGVLEALTGVPHI